MSIYSSVFGLGDECKLSCARIKKIRPKCYEQDSTQPCTCGRTPIKYQGSHVLPAPTDPREGYFGFALIPPHITRNGKDNGTKPHPYLRFHLNEGSVILTRKQVTQLHAELGQWLKDFAPKEKP